MKTEPVYGEAEGQIIEMWATFEVEGYLYGDTVENLEKNCLIPLQNKLHNVVHVTAPGDRYTGDFIFDSFSIEEGGFVDMFKVRLGFAAYSQRVVL